MEYSNKSSFVLFLSWAKVGLESKFSETGTFGGWEKRDKTQKQTRFI